MNEKTEAERETKVRELCDNLFAWSPYASDSLLTLCAALASVCASVLKNAPPKDRLEIRAGMFEFTEAFRRQLKVRKSKVQRVM